MDDVFTDTHSTFIARTLSQFTHELNNHMAIIKESAGLIGDILAISEGDISSSQGQLMDIVHSIDGQVKTSTRLIGILNRFGHRMDSHCCLFNVNEALDEILSLTARLFTTKGVKIEADLDPALPRIVNAPAILQLLCFTILFNMQQRLSKGSLITVRTAQLQAEGLVCIEILTIEKFMGNCETKDTYPKHVQQVIIDRLGAIVKYNEDEWEAVITLPLSRDKGV
ncbi:MAG: hypothetical protein HQL03_01470 [Nitrospirae bacterium]|nr:hypothetical protein [Nitrospirota bacterium]